MWKRAAQKDSARVWADVSVAKVQAPQPRESEPLDPTGKKAWQVASVFNPIPGEAETVGSLGLTSQPNKSN